MIRHLLCLVGLGMVLVSASTAAASYRNDYYGIASPISTDKPVCLPGDSPINDGFTTLLAGTLADCENDTIATPFVEVYVGWNSTSDRDSEAALRSFCLCEHTVLRRLRRPITRAGFRSASGECDLPNGWVQITWEAQRGEMPGDDPGDPPLPKEEVAVTLQTTRARLRYDLPFFQHQIDILQFYPWEQ